MKKDYRFNQYYKSLNVFSIALILLSLIFLIFKGLNYGVDFKGGTLIEIRVETEKPDIEVLRSSFNKMNLGKISIKNFGSDNDFVVKFKRDELNDPEFIENLQRNLSQELTQDFSFRRVENVGPKVSSELLKAGVTAICLSLMAMLIYIWIRFEWQFSVGAIAALFHDVIITLGIFSALSLEINLSIVAAVLTIVGYSMNDTVVIYDRVRENLKKYSDIKIFDLERKSHDTKMRKLGAIVGDGVEVGCNAVLNPGSLLLAGSMVYPNTTFSGTLNSGEIAHNEQKMKVTRFKSLK